MTEENALNISEACEDLSNICSELVRMQAHCGLLMAVNPDIRWVPLLTKLDETIYEVAATFDQLRNQAELSDNMDELDEDLEDSPATAESGEGPSGPFHGSLQQEIDRLIAAGASHITIRIESDVTP